MPSKRVSEMTSDEIRDLARARARELPEPRVAIAVDDAGNRIAVGPVITDRSVDKLRREIEASGWHVAEVIPHRSRAQFGAIRPRTVRP